MKTDLLYREIWKRKENEDQKDFKRRTEKQKGNFRKLKQKHGPCYMVNFGRDDIRPMWEDQINPNELKQIIRAKDGLAWDCPLCQPYDGWEGRDRAADKSRSFFCKIIDPTCRHGCADEEGSYAKCACLAKGNDKATLKFKRA